MLNLTSLLLRQKNDNFNTKVKHDGFIAQVIETILIDLNLHFSGLKKSSDGMYSLVYSDFVMPMINAIKEKQSIITDLVKKTYKIKDFKNTSLTFELIAENSNIEGKSSPN